MAYIGKTPASAALTSSDISDGIISTAKIQDDAATAAKIANSVNSAITANTSKTTNATHSGEVTGSGALTIAGNVVDEANLKVSNSPTNGYSLVARSGNTGGMTWEEAGGGEITMADMWRITADTASATNATISANWERGDSDGAGYIGSALSQSSGIFTFPSTGIYLISFSMRFQVNGDNAANVSLDTTLNNSSYGEAAVVTVGEHTGSSALISAASSFIFDVTNTSNCKFLFRTHSMNPNCLLKGNTGVQSTGFVCVRLGDT